MAKLKPGMREKPNGSIEYRFIYNGHRYSVTAKSVKEVLQKEQELRQDIALNGYHKNKNLTLNDYYEEWIKRREMVQKVGTVYRYKSVYKNHVKQHLGNVKIIDLERRMIIEMQSKENEKNYRTANEAVAVLSIILNDAVRDEIIMRSPAAKIPKIKLKSEAAETTHRALTRKEQAEFIKALDDAWYREIFIFMLLTGVRVGEACALKWSDIDLEEEVIHIRRTVARSTSKAAIVENSPKTDAGIRDIPLNDDIRAILLDQKKKVNKMPYVPMNMTYVFCSTRLARVIPYDVAKPLKRVIERMRKNGIQIDDFTSHAMRDTFATRYIEAGGSMQTLKKILGHSSITMTMDLYAHVLADTKKEEMNRIKII